MTEIPVEEARATMQAAFKAQDEARKIYTASLAAFIESAEELRKAIENDPSADERSDGASQNNI